MSSRPAIALFAYNRPEHVARTLDALAANDGAADHDLYAFCDGAKPQHQEAVLATRQALSNARGFRSLHTVFRDENLGCARSVRQGLDHVFTQHDRVIVVEDDILTSRHFLRMMRDILDQYADQPRVFGGTGSSEAMIGHEPPADYPYDFFFTPRPSSHGWCTWRDRWRKFIWHEDAMERLPRQPDDAAGFAIGGDDLPLQLELLRRGLIDSWAIRWAYTVYRNNGVFAYPVQPLVRNIGFDGSGLHTPRQKRRDRPMQALKRPNRFPPASKRSAALLAMFRDYYRLDWKKRILLQFMTMFPRVDLAPLWQIRDRLRRRQSR